MSRTHDAYLDARAGTPERDRYCRRWQNFLFMFACAVLHEMAHLFVCYLFRTNHPDTPPDVSYLDYAQLPGGESGRWLERELYGGAIEYLRDRMQGPDQVQFFRHLLHLLTLSFTRRPVSHTWCEMIGTTTRSTRRPFFASLRTRDVSLTPKISTANTSSRLILSQTSDSPSP